MGPLKVSKRKPTCILFFIQQTIICLILLDTSNYSAVHIHKWNVLDCLRSWQTALNSAHCFVTTAQVLPVLPRQQRTSCRNQHLHHIHFNSFNDSQFLSNQLVHLKNAEALLRDWLTGAGQGTQSYENYAPITMQDSRSNRLVQKMYKSQLSHRNRVMDNVL